MVSEIYEQSNIIAINVDLFVTREIRFNYQFLDLRPHVKGIHIFICEVNLIFTYMGLKSNCQGRWVARARVIWFAERGVLGSQRPGRFFACLCFFVGTTFHTNYLSALMRTFYVKQPFSKSTGNSGLKNAIYSTFTSIRSCGTRQH